jgi:hypothetical protein
MKIRISKQVADEVVRKMSILADEEDMQEDYGISLEQAEFLRDSVPVKGGEWEIPKWGISIVRTELEDAAKILRSIASDCEGGLLKNAARKNNSDADKLDKLFSDKK